MSRRFSTFLPQHVDWAGFAARAPHFGGPRARGSAKQKAGRRYERRAQEYLEQLFPDDYVASPWLVFRLKQEPFVRWCQPDGIRVDPWARTITIVEIKLSHTPDAYTQINGIYMPVLQHIFHGWDFRQVEVARWYDPNTHFPVPVQLISHVQLAPRGRFAVHLYG